MNGFNKEYFATKNAINAIADEFGTREFSQLDFDNMRDGINHKCKSTYRKCDREECADFYCKSLQSLKDTGVLKASVATSTCHYASDMKVVRKLRGKLPESVIREITEALPTWNTEHKSYHLVSDWESYKRDELDRFESMLNKLG